jgi:hypothetical protein
VARYLRSQYLLHVHPHTPASALPALELAELESFHETAFARAAAETILA